jgi:hypothetical protein
LLEEKRGVAIGTRSFLILNTKNNLSNVLIGNWRKENIMRIWIYARPTLDNSTIKGITAFEVDVHIILLLETNRLKI